VSAPAPLVQTTPVYQVSDTSGPTDIGKDTPWPETHKCFNCSEKFHSHPHCQKLRKQQIWSTELAEVDLKSLVAKAVAVAMDM